MKFDEETLIELEDYINALSENVGLSPETEIDVYRAIARQRRKLKNQSPPDVSNWMECVEVQGKLIANGKNMVSWRTNTH